MIILNMFFSIAEAVNLELVNFNKTTPTNGATNGHRENGVTKRKETQVEIDRPYSEYFVPVNEHKKFMR